MKCQKFKPKQKNKLRIHKLFQLKKSDDLVLIDGQLKDKKELDKLSSEEYEITKYKKPLYIINGVEYTEESLFGKTPTSPYAPLDKQEITSINVIKDLRMR